MMIKINCRFAWLAVASIFSLCSGSTLAQTMEPALQLEAKIPLGNVSGRIDHLAIDAERQRLFVAELGNNSVAIVDLKDRKVLHVIGGLKEPQGVAYVPSSDTIWVASAGDGSVKIFRADNFEPVATIDLGDDADNIRVDVASNSVFIGYGNGGLAVIDAATRTKIADIALKGHPESFQLSRSSAQIFVNVPDRKEIAVVDRVARKQTASWPQSKGGNFPMALDDENQRVVVAFRGPSAIGVFSVPNGGPVANVEACGDADDVFVDAKRHQAYVSCGSGFVDVFDTQGATYRRVAHIPTASGARTSLFDPKLDRLFVAVRAGAGSPASLWVFRPTP